MLRDLSPRRKKDINNKVKEIIQISLAVFRSLMAEGKKLALSCVVSV